MPPLERLDVSPVGYLVVAALLALLLVLSAWLDGAPRRHAPNAAVVSGIGLVAVAVGAYAGAPVLTIALLLVLSAVTLLGYEAAWRLWTHRRRHSAPDGAAGRVAR